MFAAFLSVCVKPAANRYETKDDIKVILPLGAVNLLQLQESGIPTSIAQDIVTLDGIGPVLTSARFVVGDLSVSLKVTTTNTSED